MHMALSTRVDKCLSKTDSSLIKISYVAIMS